MAGIGNLFREIQSPTPRGSQFAENLPTPTVDDRPEFLDKGAAIVLSQMLKQLGILPSAAPPGVRPSPNLDAFMFNPDPRGEFTPKEVFNREMSTKHFGNLI